MLSINFPVSGVWNMEASGKQSSWEMVFHRALTVTPENREKVIWTWTRQKLCHLLVVNGGIYLLLCFYLMSGKESVLPHFYSILLVNVACVQLFSADSGPTASLHGKCV